MSVIYINLNGFVDKYPIFKIEDTGDKQSLGQVEFDTIATLIPEICFTHNCNKVIIEGINTLAEGLKQSIYEVKKSKYTNINYPIEIEVL